MRKVDVTQTRINEGQFLVKEKNEHVALVRRKSDFQAETEVKLKWV